MKSDKVVNAMFMGVIIFFCMTPLLNAMDTNKGSSTHSNVYSHGDIMSSSTLGLIVVSTLFSTIINMVLIGVLTSTREIVKEKVIYKTNYITNYVPFAQAEFSHLFKGREKGLLTEQELVEFAEIWTAKNENKLSSKKSLFTSSLISNPLHCLANDIDFIGRKIKDSYKGFSEFNSIAAYRCINNLEMLGDCIRSQKRFRKETLQIDKKKKEEARYKREMKLKEKKVAQRQQALNQQKQLIEQEDRRLEQEKKLIEIGQKQMNQERETVFNRKEGEGFKNTN